MAADTWLLMTLYWKIDRREAVGQSLWRALAYVAGLVFMLFVAAASAAFGFFISFLTQPESPVIMPPGLVPGMLLTMVLVGVLVVGMNQAVKALFLSGDLDRLMVAPVHTRSVMVAKLLSRFPSNLLLLFLIAAPAIIAYGIGIGAGPVYFILGVILLLLAPLFGLSVGAIIAMLLVRVLPVNRLSELLTASYALLGIIIALLAQLAPRSLDQGDPEQMLESMSGAGINAAIDTLSRAPLPSFWAGRGLVALDAGQADVTGLLGIVAYVLLTLGLFAFIILTADKLYLSGWLKTQGAGGKRRGLESSGGRFGRGSLAGAIALKDWLLRLRDPRQLVSLVGSGFVAIVVGALAIFRGSGGRQPAYLIDPGGSAPAGSVGGPRRRLQPRRAHRHLGAVRRLCVSGEHGHLRAAPRRPLLPVAQGRAHFAARRLVGQVVERVLALCGALHPGSRRVMVRRALFAVLVSLRDGGRPADGVRFAGHVRIHRVSLRQPVLDGPAQDGHQRRRPGVAAAVGRFWGAGDGHRAPGVQPARNVAGLGDPAGLARRCGPRPADMGLASADARLG